MSNLIGFGLAAAMTASLGLAMTTGDKNGPDGTPRSTGAESLWQETGPTITYRPGEGVTFEQADQASLRMRGEVQAMLFFSSVEEQADILSFAARRARLKFDGYVWSKDIDYYLRIENAAGVSVLDVNAGWRVYKGDDGYIRIRLGVQKMRDSLQFSTDNTLLEFNERALATRTFSEARSTGVLIEGGMLKSEGDEHQLLWHVGAMNNDTAGGSALSSPLGINEQNKVNFNAGIAFAPQGATVTAETMHTEGDLEHSGKLKSIFGANIVYGDNVIAATNVDTFTLNLFGAANLGNGFAAQGEYFMRSDDPDGGSEANSLGWYLQGSFTTKPDDGTQWGFGGRVSMVDLDDANPILMPVSSMAGGATSLAGFSQGTVMELQAMVSAYYHKHALRTQVVYTYQDVDSDNAGAADSQNHGIDILFTLLF